jgi:hypothetical protein
VTFAGQVDVKLAYNLMKQAYEAGINFFDNAEACSVHDDKCVSGTHRQSISTHRNPPKNARQLHENKTQV